MVSAGHAAIARNQRLRSGCRTTAPDGHVATVKWGGKVVPAMARDYTSDGGHLNTVGRVHAARALVSALARAR